MRDVVPRGSGTAAAVNGIPIAGKTGTAELSTTAGPDSTTNPANTDAWFVAFPAIAHPPAAVAVMLIGAGGGGSSAAPLARQILLDALGR